MCVQIVRVRVCVVNGFCIAKLDITCSISSMLCGVKSSLSLKDEGAYNSVNGEIQTWCRNLLIVI